MLKRVLAVLALAGCSTTVMMEDPCACVVIPTMDGALSMAIGRQAVAFDGDTDGATADTLPISGLLFSPDMQFYSVTGVKVESLSGIGFEALWSEPADITRPAAMQSLFFEEDALASVAWEDGRSFDLGPQGGQVTLNEIVPRPEGGWRVRASYAAQACDEESGACLNLSGSFAFDAEQLPATAQANGLVAASS
jgi:hypothetical protein